MRAANPLPTMTKDPDQLPLSATSTKSSIGIRASCGVSKRYHALILRHNDGIDRLPSHSNFFQAAAVQAKGRSADQEAFQKKYREMVNKKNDEIG